MPVAKLKLSPRRAKWAGQFKPEVLRGRPLRPSASVDARYHATVATLVERMAKEVRRELLGLFRDPTYDAADVFVVTMDASIASQARIVLNALLNKFQSLFDEAATSATRKLVEQTLATSTTGLKGSLKDIAGNISLDTDIFTAQLDDVIKASVTESVNLIKRVPQRYFGDLIGDTMRAITSGSGIGGIQDSLDKRNVQVKNWARNTSLDQTRKLYNNINKARMEAVGIKKFEWVHSGGSHQPRPLHKNELNGKIFSFDNLPIIDERTGERGIPGQAINCRCTMRPIFDFEETDDAA